MKSMISNLAKYTKAEYSAESEVLFAFKLGLWWKDFPDYMLPHLERGTSYALPEAWREDDWYTKAPAFQFNFTADSADSWHPLYQDIRSKGWRRVNVHRQGGFLQYLFELTDASKPEDFQTIQLHLRITISTCKQVKVGTKIETVDVFETVCEGLKEIEDKEADRADAQDKADAEDDNPHPYGQVDSIVELPYGTVAIADIKTTSDKDGFPF